MLDMVEAKSKHACSFFFQMKNVNNMFIGLDMLLCTEKTKLFGGDRLKTFRALKNVVGVNEKREHPLM